jgi:periplasmic divalent cation tolerance protein
VKSASGIVQVFVSVPSARVAADISRVLLDAHLCACAQTLGPMTSRYRWKGRVERAREWLLLVKTERRQLRHVERCVRELHPYDVPEMLVVPVQAGYAPYLAWLRAQVSPAASGR